jgi:hypothetical protein
VSLAVLAACWPLQMPPTVKAVLISMADSAEDDGTTLHGVDTLCARTCLGRTAVMESIRWLELNGVLDVERCAGRPSRYTVTPEQFGVQGRLPLNQSATRTRPPRGPVRHADHTSPAGGPHPSATRTTPVRVADPSLLRARASKQKQEQKKRDTASRFSIELPEWLSADAWTIWDRYRSASKGWNADARAFSLRSLTKLYHLGHDPLAVIEQSIERSWTGLFPLKPEASHGTPDQRGGRRRNSAVEQVVDAIRERGLFDKTGSG